VLFATLWQFDLNGSEPAIGACASSLSGDESRGFHESGSTSLSSDELHCPRRSRLSDFVFQQLGEHARHAFIAKIADFVYGAYAGVMPAFGTTGEDVHAASRRET
jgi:hypothetical protein